MDPNRTPRLLGRMRDALWRPRHIPARLWLDRAFGIDLRALSVFRIGLAVLLLYDLANRAQFLEAHYSDFGILPRDKLAGSFSHPWFIISLHTLSGSVLYEAVLFAIAAVFACCLLMGWHTRLAQFGCWILLVSLHARNPLLLQGGDLLVRMLLFWSWFLPLATYASLDARKLAQRRRNSDGRDTQPPHEPHPPRRIVSVASAAILLQIAMVYLFSGYMKRDPIWERDGTGIFFALHLDAFATSWGAALLEHRELLRVMSFATLYLERFAPWLAFIPLRGPWLRIVVVSLFWGLHLGLIVTMQLGPFPYVCLLAWSLFLPSEVWDALSRIVPQRWRRPAGSLDQVPLAAETSIAAESTSAESHWQARFKSLRAHRLIEPFVAVMLFGAIMWNVRVVWPVKWHWHLPPAVDPLIVTLRLDQGWGMFAPYPLIDDFWLVMTGTLADGRTVNLWDPSQPVTDDKPDLRHFYPGERWRKYCFNLWDRENMPARRPFMAWLVRRWNRDHAHSPGEHCVHGQLKAWVERTVLDEFGPWDERILLEYDPAIASQ